MIRTLLSALLISHALGHTLQATDSVSAISNDYEKCQGGYYPDSVWAAKSAIAWDPAIERVPLLPRDAKAIACDKLRDHLKDHGAIDVIDGSVRLIQVGEAWVYTVVMGWMWHGISMRGTPLWACVHVRMDKDAVVAASLLVTPPPNGLLTAPGKTTNKRFLELLSQRSGHEYRACGNSENAALEPIAKLESFHANNLKISGQTLGDAFNSVLKACGSGTGDRKIASVLRAANLDDERRIAFEAKEISFIAAVDALCVQAGAKWVIVLDNPDQVPPVLIILPNESGAGPRHTIKNPSPPSKDLPSNPTTQKSIAP